MPEQSQTRCDIAFRNATIIDGTGAARFAGDVAVNGDRIAAVGDLGQMAVGREVDCAGAVLAPGFIDVHTHDDHALLMRDAMIPKITQGVTTVVTGNCGISLAPITLIGPPIPPLDLLGGTEDYRYSSFDSYIAALEVDGAPVNAAPMVGHKIGRAHV